MAKNDDNGLSPWRETRDLNRDDQRLRHAGFAIWERNGKSEPVWVKDGRHYTQRQAMESLK